MYFLPASSDGETPLRGIYVLDVGLLGLLALLKLANFAVEGLLGEPWGDAWGDCLGDCAGVAGPRALRSGAFPNLLFRGSDLCFERTGDGDREGDGDRDGDDERVGNLL